MRYYLERVGGYSARVARLLVRGAQAARVADRHVGAGLPRPHGRRRAGAGGLMDLGLQERVALVTGASRGIGRAIAEALAAEGARVAVAARTATDVETVAATIGGRGYTFDSDDLDSIDPLLDAIEADLGPIDVYVANTGGPPRFEDPLAPSAAEWEAAHRSLVVSPMLVMKRLVPGMRSRGFGRVVAVSSFVAREPLGGLQLSNVNRPGLLGGMKLLAHDCAADGVTFNAVLPGRIATDRIAAGYSDGMEGAQAAAAAEVPAGRLGTTAEIAAVAAFLCSARRELRDGPVAARRRRPHARLVAASGRAALLVPRQPVVGDRLPPDRVRDELAIARADARIVVEGREAHGELEVVVGVAAEEMRAARDAEPLLEAAVGVAPPRHELLARLKVETRRRRCGPAPTRRSRCGAGSVCSGSTRRSAALRAARSARRRRGSLR